MKNDYMHYEYIILTEHGQWYGFNELTNLIDYYDLVEGSTPIILFENGFYVPEVYDVDSMLGCLDRDEEDALLASYSNLEKEYLLGNFG